MIKDDFNDYSHRPKWLRKLMHERQVEQGNPLDSIIFDSFIDARRNCRGFNWALTPEGYTAWSDAIYRKDYALLLKANPDIIPEEGDTMGEKSIKAWVAADEDGIIWIYENKPKKDIRSWFGKCDLIEQRFLPFPAPTWEDEPIQIEITIKKV